MGTGYRGVGVTLWATPTPPPPFALLREGMTALHWAAYRGHQRSVRALINAGASLDIQTTGNGLSGRWDSRLGGSARPKRCGRGGPVPPSVARRKCTPLHDAAGHGRAAATAALLGYSRRGRIHRERTL